MVENTSCHKKELPKERIAHQHSLSTKPLIDELKKVVKALQAWFADDATAGGRIKVVKAWWDLLFELGPSYGYFPKPSKMVLIVKCLKDFAFKPYLLK